MSTPGSAARPAHPLEDPRFREALTRMVRRSVPESDAEDIVQTAIAEALVAGKRDDDPDALRRWVWGVARHKVVDHFRRRRRLADELPDVAGEDASQGELDLLRWARRELPEGENAEETLRWMLREAEGETLETIAEESNLPAPRVRKRVSRLREHFRARWSGQAAALLALGVVVVVLVVVALRKRTDDIAKDQPAPSLSAPTPGPREVAAEKRRAAFERCGAGAFRPCLDLFDEARGLDPAGDEAEAVQRARKAATDALEQRVAPVPTKAVQLEKPRGMGSDLGSSKSRGPSGYRGRRSGRSLFAPPRSPCARSAARSPAPANATAWLSLASTSASFPVLCSTQPRPNVSPPSATARATLEAR
jgi:RNA polymerase sigma factor (sigma-70 family)